jgi:hypothetical protein
VKSFLVIEMANEILESTGKDHQCLTVKIICDNMGGMEHPSMYGLNASMGNGYSRA